MKLCEHNCHPICDFCIFYKDDGSGFIENGREKGTFEGEGFCIKKNKRVDASMFCYTDFECFNTLPDIQIEISNDSKEFIKQLLQE